MTTRRIICVCSGNICRSPMAVALLKQKLNHRGVSAMVISGGTLGIQNRRASEFARAAIAELGGPMVDTIEQHRSQGLSAGMLQRADDILVMAPRHEQYIRRVAPHAADDIVRLWQYGGDKTLRRIPDPVGHNAEVFRGCRDLIDRCLEGWLDEWCESE